MHQVKPECRKFKKTVEGPIRMHWLQRHPPPIRSAICEHCCRKGHIVKICRSAPQKDLPTSSRPKSKASPRSTDESCYTVTKCHCSTEAMISWADTLGHYMLHLTIQIEGAPCKMEVDIRSAMSIISWSTIERLVPRFAKRQLDPQHSCGGYRSVSGCFQKLNGTPQTSQS